MRYTLLLHYPEMTAEDIGEDAIEAGKQAFHRYASALEAAGVLASAEMFQPVAHSITLAQRDGALRVKAGPRADINEQLGGTFVIEVPDLDAALVWAEKCPTAAWGTVEVRPSSVRFVGGKWVALS